MKPIPDAGLEVLRAVSARLGADPALVQAGGGNTSCKSGGVLWVKASGRWLARALDEPVFVPLDLALLQTAIADGDEGATARAVLPAAGCAGLRPSIETLLHALLPHRVVLHVHPVAALAWLCCRTEDAVFERRLQGLRWTRVPYIHPGLPLTQGVRDRLQRRPADVLLLDNHGIVAGADSAAGADALLRDVVRRLDVDALPVPAAAPSLPPLPEGTTYRWAPEAACHALACDPRQRAFAAGGAPYPDHVVFLGGGLPVLARESLSRVLLGALDAPALLVADAGVLVHEALDAAGLAMLRCLADVASRIAARPGAEPVYLPSSEVDALQRWDAEKYRRAQVSASA